MDVVTLDELPDLTQPGEGPPSAASTLNGPRWLLGALTSCELGPDTPLSSLWSVWLHLAPDALLQ